MFNYTVNNWANDAWKGASDASLLLFYSRYNQYNDWQRIFLVLRVAQKFCLPAQEII